MESFYKKGETISDISSIKNKKVVLFPAGSYTKLLLQYQKPNNIFCICDNSSGMQGRTISDIPIVSPQKLSEEEGDFCIIVTSPNLERDFTRQLKELNLIDRCEFIVCNWGSVTAPQFYDPFTFEDKRKNHTKTLLVLAGYKQKLWDIVFKRIKRFVPSDIDVCVMSSGKYVPELSQICRDNNWSYLSTQKNNLSLIQNIAIKLHPNAEYIYKLDEDMFICEGFFDGLLETYRDVEKNSRYRVGMVAPLIPVNVHGSIRFMEKMNCLEEFEDKFGKAYYDFHTHFEGKTGETLFLWEHTLPLDETSKKIRSMPYSYFVCPHRFSIGAILFKRTTWEEMGGFKVKEGSGLGSDEYDFAAFFLTLANFYSFIIAENVLAGHYSYGMLNNPALIDDFYYRNKEHFDLLEA
ncbi:hypothetical protein B1A99_21875 [Cohnella sp. CIP 111063]|uniref:hypothetical protein n=1 Tax=unclassified Cohnella TaxID=2636738 RepID=UPI000B8BCB98|nr:MULTISPECIES: hypothetical protein [unclassified Cohnella]OXS55877.1 hypothetical protein B1A99_21875 [Cohnella sp. CIP 111063]PRX67079.1 C-methyltransferase-like protein [Cohnella sp. SGD-V74]